MSAVVAILVGALYAAGLYLLLRRSIVKLLIGIVFLSHASNLLIFDVARLVRESAPLIPPGEERLAAGAADPLPQALVLTAVVISFGILAFAIALFHRAHQSSGTDDMDVMRSTDT